MTVLLWYSLLDALRAGSRLIMRHDGHRRYSSAWIFLLATAWPVESLAGQAAGADTVRIALADARARAVSANPELAATRLEIAIAEGQLRQAGLIRTNPSVDLLAAGTSGTRPEIGVSQEIEFGGQRGLRLMVARAGVSRARYSTANALRLVLTDVERTFYRLIAARHRTTLADEVLSLAQRLSQVAIKQLREGEISKLDYNLSVIELGRTRAASLAAHRDEEATTLELRRFIGLASEVVVVPVYDSLHHHALIDSVRGTVELRWSTLIAGRGSDVAERDTVVTLSGLLLRAMAVRSDLGERYSAAAESEGLITLARREALPNLLARVLVQQNNAGTGQAIRPGIGLTIPAFNRQQGAIDARRAAATQSRLDLIAAVSRVRLEVERAYRAYQSAAQAVEVLEATVLGPARDNRRLLEAAYREGKVGLPVLLLIRNQVISAELDYWNAWLAEREALAELAGSVGIGDGIASHNARPNAALPPGLLRPTNSP